MVFPVTTTEEKRYAIFMQNRTLVVDKETETLISVAILLKSGFDVKFVTAPRKTLHSPDILSHLIGRNLHDAWRQPMAIAYRE